MGLDDTVQVGGHLALTLLEAHVGHAQQRRRARVQPVRRLEAARRLLVVLVLVGRGAELMLLEREVGVLLRRGGIGILLVVEQRHQLRRILERLGRLRRELGRGGRSWLARQRGHRLRCGGRER